MEQESRVRILIAKPGLDGHERGARVVAFGLRDEGFEVIYTGLRQTPEQIVRSAIQEDVSVIGLSILSGAHISLSRKVLDGLRENNAGDIMVLVGGIIPDKDIEALKGIGVAEVFTSGSRIKDIAGVIRQHMKSQ
ncbi:MAG: cobalamin B12-binding domain-containing protein [Deltaproteobacteria bacterium]|nr:cobalamin B12-binding domain-containing protein [Deltaproteobacteria bacterium]